MKKEFKVTMAALLMTSLFGCGSSTSASSASSSQSETYHVTIIKQLDHASIDEIAKAITARLDQIADEKGVTIEYGEVYSGQNDQATIRQITDQAVNEGVDAIIPIATMAAQTAVTSALGTETKVVFAAVSDPESAELVDFDNVTGTSDALSTEVIFDMMKAADPDLDKVGLLYSLSEINSEKPIKEAKAYCDANGIEYVQATGNTNDEIISAVTSLISEDVDAIFTPTDNVVMANELAIAPVLAEKGIPHYTGADSFALNGAFVGYGVDYANLGQKTADMIADILVDNADPAKTAVETFDNGTATVNTETCKELGLDFDTVKKAFEPLCTQVNEITTAESFDEVETK